MYAISYMYYSLIGTALTVLIGYIVSYLTQDPKDSYDAKLLHPAVFRFYQRFWKGDKPYYVKDVNTVVTTVVSGGSNGVVVAHGGGGSGATGAGLNGGGSESIVRSGGNSADILSSGAKINHAFEPQNEANIIIGVGSSHSDSHINGKDKNPMEVIFTKSLPATEAVTPTTPLSAASATAAAVDSTTSLPPTISTTNNLNGDAGIVPDSTETLVEMPKAQNTSQFHYTNQSATTSPISPSHIPVTLDTKNKLNLINVSGSYMGHNEKASV